MLAQAFLQGCKVWLWENTMLTCYCICHMIVVEPYGNFLSNTVLDLIHDC